MSSSPMCLSWHDHAKEFANNTQNLLHSNTNCDISIICDRKETLKAHRVILQMSSEYFASVFDTLEPWQYPVLLLKDVKVNHMRAILEFIYCGKTRVDESEMDEVIQLAKWLAIKGLHGETDKVKSEPEFELEEREEWEVDFDDTSYDMGEEMDNTNYEDEDFKEFIVEEEEDEQDNVVERSKGSNKTDRFYLRSAVEMDDSEPYPGDEGDYTLTVLHRHEEDDIPIKVAINGFVYGKNMFKTKTRYWRCWHKKCPGTMVTDAKMTEFKFNHPHFHPKEYLEIEKFKICQKVNHLASTSDDLNSTQILNIALEGASDELIEAVHELKKTLFVNIRRKKRVAGKASDLELLQRSKKPKLSSNRSSKKKFLKDEVKLTHTFKGDEGDNILELIRNKAGVGHSAILNDFLYHKRNQNEDAGKIYWHCRRKDCHGSMMTDMQGLSGEANIGHYHPKEPLHIQKVREMLKLKDKSRERRFEAPSVLVEEALAGLNDELKAIMPDKRSLQNNIHRWRKDQ